MVFLLLTRPHRQSERFRALIGRQVPTIISPLVRIEALEVSLPPAVAGVVLTSANGAEALVRTGLDRSVPVFAVGDRTAEVARRAGFRVRSAAGAADDLVRMILQAHPRGPLVHLRGEETRGEIAGRLAAAGLECGESIAYRQVAEPLTGEASALLAGAAPVVVPLFSPKTGSAFASAGPFVAPLRLVCISRAVANSVAGLPVAGLRIAGRPDAAAMALETFAALDA